MKINFFKETEFTYKLLLKDVQMIKFSDLQLKIYGKNQIKDSKRINFISSFGKNMENMENYMAIHNWLTGLGFPETAEQYENLTTDDQGIRDSKEAFSDGSLSIYD